MSTCPPAPSSASGSSSTPWTSSSPTRWWPRRGTRSGTVPCPSLTLPQPSRMVRYMHWDVHWDMCTELCSEICSEMHGLSVCVFPLRLRLAVTNTQSWARSVFLNFFNDKKMGKGADCELQLGIEAQYVGALLKLFFSSLPSTVYKTASFQFAQVAFKHSNRRQLVVSEPLLDFNEVRFAVRDFSLRLITAHRKTHL